MTDPLVEEHAAGLIESLAQKASRERLRANRQSAKGRSKFALAVSLTQPFDPARVHRVPHEASTPDAVADELRRRGAGAECVVFTADGHEIVESLDSAIERVVGHAGGAVISCLPGALAYAEDESGTRLLLF